MFTGGQRFGRKTKKSDPKGLGMAGGVGWGQVAVLGGMVREGLR